MMFGAVQRQAKQQGRQGCLCLCLSRLSAQGSTGWTCSKVPTMEQGLKVMETGEEQGLQRENSGG